MFHMPMYYSFYAVQLFFLDYSSEAFGICVGIVTVHTLLAPELVMRSHGLQIMTVCDSMMNDLKNEAVMAIMRVVETYLRASPALGAETAMPILPRIFE